MVGPRLYKHSPALVRSEPYKPHVLSEQHMSQALIMQDEAYTTRRMMYKAARAEMSQSTLNTTVDYVERTTQPVIRGAPSDADEDTDQGGAQKGNFLHHAGRIH